MQNFARLQRWRGAGWELTRTRRFCIFVGCLSGSGYSGLSLPSLEGRGSASSTSRFLRSVSGAMGNRIRRHADPLQCRVAVGLDDWIGPYRSRGEGELWLDLGCGKGEFLAQLAAGRPAVFFIGIEVRLSIVRRFFPAYGHIPNLLLIHGNVNLSVPSMMGGRKAQRVLINFPDPFDHKPRYRKRRMVNEQLVEGISRILAPAGVVSVKTDRENLFHEMDALFRSRLEPLASKAGERPVGRPALSEWETECRRYSIPVFSMEYGLPSGEAPTQTDHASRRDLEGRGLNFARRPRKRQGLS